MSTHPNRLPQALRNDLRELRKAAVREAQRRYVAEGPHLAADIAASTLVPEIVVVRNDADHATQEIAERLASRGASLYTCGSHDMDLITDAASPQPILCVMAYHPERPLGDRILALDAVSDPGNVGTMIRTAAWFGFTDVVLGTGCADLYNPKVMRSTAGAALVINVVRRRQLDAWMASLDERPRVAAVARGGEPPAILHPMERFVVVIGSEAHGISPDNQRHCTHMVTIPGHSGVESLNAATAAAILCYEGRRV